MAGNTAKDCVRLPFHWLEGYIPLLEEAYISIGFIPR